MINPFTFGKVAAGRSFADRENELIRIRQNILSHINTILISPRRWGKTSLVEKVSEDNLFKKKNSLFCFIDLFNIRNEQEFYETFARELLKKSASKTEEWIENGKSFFKKIIPTFNFSVDPLKDFSVSFDWKAISKHPDEVLNLPEIISKTKKIPVVICLDEFQNISFFENPLAFQKKLRACWQHHKQATYCLYGSKRHLMMELFERQSMPFYKFGDVVFLEKIQKKYWNDFILLSFKRTRKKIDPESAAFIAETMENHPYFVQQLAYTAWNLTTKNCNKAIVEKAIELLFGHNIILFQRDTDNLTNTQVNFLKALSNGEEQFSSFQTIQQYRLGTSANVIRIKKSLEEKEIIDTTAGKIEFSDPLFKQWFGKVYMRK